MFTFLAFVDPSAHLLAGHERLSSAPPARHADEEMAMFHTLEVKTHQRIEYLDITAAVQELVNRHGPLDGVCYLFVPHTTAGITINEHADPDVQRDILMALNSLIRDDAPYRHAEGNAPAHIKSVLTGNTVTVIVASGRLALGTWQGIFFCEYDGPRRRQVRVKFIQG